MRSQHVLRVAVLLASLIPAVVTAQAPPDLLRAMRSRDSAVALGNAVTWNRLSADDFTVVNQAGVLMTKSERLAQLKTQTPSALSAVQRERITRVGQLFIRRYITESMWVMEVWAKGPKGWRVSAVQVTPIK